MKNQNKNDKIAFICFVVASICFFISALIGMISDDGSNWVVNMCLGSAFLCISSTYLNKDKSDENK